MIALILINGIEAGEIFFYQQMQIPGIILETYNIAADPFGQHHDRHIKGDGVILIYGRQF